MQHPWDQRLGVWWIAEDHPGIPGDRRFPQWPDADLRRTGLGRASRGELVESARTTDGDVVATRCPTMSTRSFGSWPPARLGCGTSFNHRAVPDEFAVDPRSLRTQPRWSFTSTTWTGSPTSQTTPPYGCAILAGGHTAPAPGFMADDELLANQSRHAARGARNRGRMSYSSGTTGKPKGIVRPCMRRDPSASGQRPWRVRPGFRVPAVRRRPPRLDRHAPRGCQSFYLGALNVGQPLAIMDRSIAEKTLGAIEKRSRDNGVHGSHAVRADAQATHRGP